MIRLSDNIKNYTGSENDLSASAKAAKANETGKKLTMDKEVLILENLPPLPPVPVLETTQE